MEIEWVPVSERQPERDEFYLTTVELSEENLMGEKFIVITTVYVNKQWLYSGLGIVRAWMELPEPLGADHESDNV